MRKRERVRECGQWVTQKEINARAFNKRCLLLFRGNYLTKPQKKALKLKKMAARTSQPQTLTVELRP